MKYLGETLDGEELVIEDNTNINVNSWIPVSGFKCPRCGGTILVRPVYLCNSEADGSLSKDELLLEMEQICISFDCDYNTTNYYTVKIEGGKEFEKVG